MTSETEIIYEINTEINLPNITVYTRYADGVFAGYRLNTNDGYVMYNITDNDVEINPDTGEEIPVIYYCRICYIPRNNPNAPYNWVAVPEDEVPEDHIFGDNTEHEVV